MDSSEDAAAAAWAARTAASLTLNVTHVRRFGEMLGEGCTVPFIVRYRAPSVGGMSGPDGHKVRESWEVHAALKGTRAKVIAALTAAGALTPELRRRVLGAASAGELDDLYSPFKVIDIKMRSLPTPPSISRPISS